ncbi:MAG: DMT family transporter [Cyanothece sp. SIO1E1]|nr:DMT family transporter [Cyanothece sp. SIO1E1]
MKNIFLFITPTLIWGSTWYVIKFQVGDVDPMFSVAYRFLLAGVIMLMAARFMKLKLSFTRKEHAFILLQGLFIFGFNYWFVYISELYLTSGLVGLIFSLLVFFNIINARIFLKNELELKVVLGGLLGLLGTALIFWDDLKVFSFEDGKLIGLALAIGGTFIASLGNITSARNTKAGIPVISSNAFGMTYGGGAMMLIALISGKELSFIATPEYIGSLFYLAIFGSIVAFGAYLTLVGNIGAGKAAYVSLIAPVIALIISTFLEDYQWTALSLGGATLILGGNLIALWRSAEKNS